MPSKFGTIPPEPPDAYPDPIGEARRSAGLHKLCRLTDEALAGDISASRLFTQLPIVLARDVWEEVRREQEREKGE